MQRDRASEGIFLQSLLLSRQIEQVMSAENEDNWIHGIRTIIAELEGAIGNIASQNDALKRSGATYKTMMGVKDGFGDYMIWRDDRSLLAKANKELDTLRSELWQLLVEDAGL